MDNVVVKEPSNINWKDLGITAGIMLVVGFFATLGALYVHGEIQKMAEKKAEKGDAPKKA